MVADGGRWLLMVACDERWWPVVADGSRCSAIDCVVATQQEFERFDLNAQLKGIKPCGVRQLVTKHTFMRMAANDLQIYQAALPPNVAP